MTGMNILFIVPYTPNLIRVRPYNLIRSLAARGNQIHLVTLANSQQDLRDADHLREYCQEVLTFRQPQWRSMANSLAALPRNIPLQAVYSWNPEMAKSLRRLVAIRHYDVIHVEHLRGAEYGLDLQKAGGCPPVVWDSVDSISLLFGLAASRSKRLINRWMTRFELQRTRLYEAHVQECFDQILVTSQIDREAFLDLRSNRMPAAPISVLPNGVDLQYYAPNEDVARQEDTLVISGKMSYHANVSMVMSFAKEVLPLIWQKRPTVRLCVVGKDPTPEIRKLAENPMIEVTGSVADIRPYLQRAAIAVTPIIYGVGIQNKVLEAMACGTPVVSTSQAVSALGAIPGTDVLVGDEPAELAGLILDLLSDPARQKALSKAGRKYVERQHRWETIAENLEAIYRTAVAVA